MVTRRDFLKTSALVGSGLALPACGQNRVPPDRGRRPNVLFIYDDQLRQDVLGIYGGRNITTPHMDQLARQGMRFTKAFTPYPLCSPARAALLTGMFPTHSGTVANWFNVNPYDDTLADVFTEAGYQTGFIGKWHLAAGLRAAAGLSFRDDDTLNEYTKRIRRYRLENPDSEYVPPGRGRLGFDHWEAYNFHVKFNNGFFYRNTKEKIVWDQFETDALTNLAIDYMEIHKNDDQPFFLVVAPHPPHPPYKERWMPLGYLDALGELTPPPNVPADHPWWNEEVAKIRCYYAMCKNFDDNVGRLMEYLDESALANDTLVVLTSDHGDQLGSQNKIYKMKPYRESIDLPLIMRWPGRIKADTVCDSLQTPLDFMPTFSGMFGMETPSSADGVDLSDLILKGQGPKRPPALLANYTAHWDYMVSSRYWNGEDEGLGVEWRGVRDDQFTYARTIDGREELFDNESDPYQMQNLASGSKKDENTLKKMRSVMKELLVEAHDDFPEGEAYIKWYDENRNVVRTGRGPV